MNTSRLTLRKINEDDIGDVYAGLSNPDVIRYYGVSYNSLDATREQMAWFQELEDSQRGQWWAICPPDRSTLYGACGFNDWDHAHRKSEVGFWLLPEYWGKGFAAEAVALICQHGFTQMNLHRIEAYVDAENLGCKRVLAKLGFVHEGCMRECERKNERIVSIDLFSKLSSD